MAQISNDIKYQVTSREQMLHKLKVVNQMLRQCEAFAVHSKGVSERTDKAIGIAISYVQETIEELKGDIEIIKKE